MILSKALFQYTVLSAVRDRLFLAMIIMIMAGTGLTIFMSGSAIVETQKFSVALAGGVLRLLGVVGLVTFISFQLRRAFDNKEIEYVLAAPVSRPVFLSSVASAYMVMAFIMAFIISNAIGILMGDITQGLILWGASIIAEFIIVSVMALFFAAIIRSATISVLATLGFYALSRMIGVLTGIVKAQAIRDTPMNDLIGKIMDVISFIVPRLDLMGQTSWLVYGAGGDVHLAFIGVQTILFVALFITAAAFDLQRNQF